MLIDKNDKPKWDYKTLEEVPKEVMLKHFEKLPPHLELY